MFDIGETFGASLADRIQVLAGNLELTRYNMACDVVQVIQSHFL